MPPQRPFQYHRGRLQAGGVDLAPLAERFGTPLYVYDFDAVQAAYRAYQTAFHGLPLQVCAAVKANGNLALLRRLAEWGSGFDVVSGGELERVRAAGGDADKIVFSGVGKTAAEMDLALRAGIQLFQVSRRACSRWRSGPRGCVAWPASACASTRILPPPPIPISPPA